MLPLLSLLLISTGVPLGDEVVATAAILSALVAVTILGNKVYQMIKRIDDAIGVDDKGRTLSQRLEAVEHQLWPNGGSSLNDKVTHIYRHQSALIRQIETELGIQVRKEDYNDDEA